MRIRYNIKRRSFRVLALCLVFLTILMYLLQRCTVIIDADIARRHVAKNLAEALNEDKETKCKIPNLDPFDYDLIKFNREMPNFTCQGYDWVKCYKSKCRVRYDILDQYKSVHCKYQDMILTDFNITFGNDVLRRNKEIYELVKSDYVFIECVGEKDKYNDRNLPTSWSGMGHGFRSLVNNITKKPVRSFGHNNINILFICFHSASKNGFIRNMPLSYKVLTDEMNSVVLNGYNIAGDNTAAIFLPIFTGKSELELPERRKVFSRQYLDDFPFIFYKLQELGYKTAYFEDHPGMGTFHRFNGFKNQPTDHYMRHCYLGKDKALKDTNSKYCIGDTHSYRILLDATEQFFDLTEKKFVFTFIADITHDNFDVISISDAYFASWLRTFEEHGHLHDTLLFVMGDHGPRNNEDRISLIAKLEERLPLMAIRLPRQLEQSRPDAFDTLNHNADVLATPQDIHATVLDALNMKKQTEKHGRAYSLLQEISNYRRCAEAGVEKHWCICLKGTDLLRSEPMFEKAAEAFLDYINGITAVHRKFCLERELKSIEYVRRHTPDDKLLKFSESLDQDGYLARFNHFNTKIDKEDYTVKIILGPRISIYEGSTVYVRSENIFKFDEQSISLVKDYENPPLCIAKKYPHLKKYCYCKEQVILDLTSSYEVIKGSSRGNKIVKEKNVILY